MTGAPGDRRDGIGDALEVLDVHRRHDVDAGVANDLDVLPTLGAGGSRHVRVRQLVDQGDRRIALEDGVRVHLLDDDAAVLDPPARHDLEAVEQLLRVRPAVRFDEPDGQVGPARGASMAFLEHPERLADARRHPEVDAETTAPGALLRANARQHLVRARADVEGVALRARSPEQAVQIEVELEDVDSGLAEEAEELPRRVAGDRRPDVSLGRSASRRDPGDLVVGGRPG